MVKNETSVKNANSATSAKTTTNNNVVTPATVKPTAATAPATSASEKNAKTETAPLPTANGTQAPIAATETPQAANVPTVQNAAPTAESTPQPTKAETIEELKKRLEIELNRLNHKKKLAAHREQFINSLNSLQLYADELKNESEFETQSGKLTFNILTTDNYNRPSFADAFSITNTALISKFCNILLSEMEQKIVSLETELLTA